MLFSARFHAVKQSLCSVNINTLHTLLCVRTFQHFLWFSDSFTLECSFCARVYVCEQMHLNKWAWHTVYISFPFITWPYHHTTYACVYICVCANVLWIFFRIHFISHFILVPQFFSTYFFLTHTYTCTFVMH